METVRTVIADDEKPARRRLLELLEREPGVEVVSAARDGREAVELIERDRPDLLFLDIQMPELDGMGVVRTVGPEQMPATIFVTAYDQYAIQAFEAQALDYLLKPFSDERFEAALRRARALIAARKAGELQQRMGRWIDPKADTSLKRLALKSKGRVTFLDVDRIDWIEAAGVYVNLHTSEKSHLYRATIGQMLEKLDPEKFVRVHRSAAVHTGRIRELQTLGHGEYIVVLNDGTEVKLSRKYRPELEQWLRQPL
jgi:two-component system LytT family response regulator